MNASSLSVVRTHEAPKDARVLMSGNPYAMIPHPEFDGQTCHIPFQGDADRPSLWTIFDGVGQQIGEHLLNAPGINACFEPGLSGGKAHLVLQSRFLKPLHHAPGQGNQIRQRTL